MNDFITLLVALGYATLGFVAGCIYKTWEIKKMTELPRYKSHKTVQALKIADIILNVPEKSSTGATIIPTDEGYAPVQVDAAYMDKHNPQVGGYYVVYEDGYKSFSPAQAFEAGYTKI